MLWNPQALMSEWNWLGKGNSQKKENFLTANRPETTSENKQTKNLENKIHKFVGSYISKREQIQLRLACG